MSTRRIRFAVFSGPHRTPFAGCRRRTATNWSIRTLIVVAVLGIATLAPQKSFAIGPCNPRVQVCS